MSSDEKLMQLEQRVVDLQWLNAQVLKVLNVIADKLATRLEALEDERREDFDASERWKLGRDFDSEDV